MYTSTLSSQGQTTVPIQVRKYLNIPSGKSLRWTISKSQDGTKTLSVSTNDFLTLKGIAEKSVGSLETINEMREEWDK